MPSLSVVKVELTTILKWAGLILGVLIGLFLVFKVLITVKNIVAPPPKAPPTVSFGKIPVPYLPSGIKRNFTYTLDTVSGNLPAFPDREPIFKMKQISPQLLNFKNASGKIATLGFDPKPEKLSESVYRWKQNGQFTRVLVLDINRSQFDLSSNFLEDPNVTTANNLPTPTEAISQAKDFLSTLGVYPSDINDDKTQTILYKVTNSIIRPATNINSANLVSVYFHQKDKNRLPIVYPGGKISSMNVTISGGSNGGQVVDARFFYQQIEKDNGTYPIITSEQAFSRLKDGKGYVASVDPGIEKIRIKKVYLAYYSPGRTSYFLMPVVVFEGNDNFVAYVSAVKDEWLSN